MPSLHNGVGERMRHAFAVARHFRPLSRAWWLAVFHDGVEDGWLPQRLTTWFPALDAVTRRDGERYFDYIARCSRDELAFWVKLADLEVNIERCKRQPKGDLLQRYLRARHMMREWLPMNDVTVSDERKT